ncbi:peptidylprolyl isomerase [Salipaludibacillus sp. CUR1]|uniref:peptidylprolyl isomerase n=1 Tax=Salipaludibacillus sp. CUR1 TaxID=2820003 RepID=UPI001E5AED09|nr:peptidylprolyl isomerase [Salipaludibacillus sp. CUR1]MCE7791196.1 peptidylprolyl isomerase [Salipaludibacillus sp. CUR1]
MKKANLLAGSGLSLMLLLAGCGEENNQNNVNEGNNNGDGSDEAAEYPQLSEEVAENEEEAVLRTNYGDIHVKLFPEAAPKAVENFMTLAEEGYYEGVIFHRVIEDFMIQGGDPTGTGGGGESAFGEPFEDEFDESVAHFRGALAMANSGPNTNGSQFYIVHAGPDQLSEEAFEAMEQQGMDFSEDLKENYLELGGTPHLDDGHTVFGHVIDGMDVVDDIAITETEHGDRPVEEVVIESVEVID